MLNKQIKAITFLLTGLFTIILGLFMLNNSEKTLILLINIFGYGIIIIGILKLLTTIFSKNKFNSFIESIVNIIFGILIIFGNNVILISGIILFSIYLNIISLTHFINYLIYRNNNIKGRLLVFIKFITTIIFSIILFLNPKPNLKYLGLIFGLYLIIFGITNITDFLTEILNKKVKNKIKQSIKIQLPILLTMFIPKRLITLINEILEKEEDINKLDIKKNNLNPDIEVIIHLAKSGSASMGHVEIAYKNKIYSYGNYNMHSRKLFNSIGDGIVLIADKNKYIKYCVTHKERYLIVFGIKLTDIEIKEVEKRIEKLITTNTIDYYPDQALADMGKLENKVYNDMSSEIYRLAEGKFKKIIKGKHKKFFVLKTNCSMVANYILSSVGKNIIAINGIITPGAYYDYLNNRFMMKNTNVISRKIYTKEDFKGE